jgi:hypothetical protein
MGVWDSVLSVGEAASGTLGAIPVVGEAMNAAGAAYHTGAAVYDGVTGDRDGAVNHGAQAIYNGIGCIPAVSEAMGTVDAVASGVGAVARGGTAIAGGDPSQVPGGIGDLIGSTAVMATNAIFGPDDSNWIASGNTPQGTRGGEIAAGAGTLGAIAGAPLGPLGMAGGAWLGSQVGPWLGGLLGSNNAGPTSGARNPDGSANGWPQGAGDWIHNAPGRAANWMNEQRSRYMYGGGPGG